MITLDQHRAALLAIRTTASASALDLRLLRIGQDITYLAMLRLRAEPVAIDAYARDVQRLSRQSLACAAKHLELAKKAGRRG